MRKSTQTEYINMQHTSPSVIMCLNLAIRARDELLNTKNPEEVDAHETKIAMLLSILEPLLVNNTNLEQAMQEGVMEFLMKLIQSQIINPKDPNTELHKYLKFAMRCMTCCLRNPKNVE